MSEHENDPSAVLAAQHDPDAALARENAELRKRLAALEQQNVVEGRFTGEIPRYSLNEAGFYDDTWFAEGTVIEFTGIPNMTMVPLNESAKRAMRENIRTLEEGARRVAFMRGRDYQGLVTDRNVLIDTARADAKALADAPVPVIQMPQPTNGVPPMPHTPEAQAMQRRGPGRPKKVMSAEAPARQGPPDVGSQMLAPAFPNLMPAVVGRISG